MAERRRDHRRDAAFVLAQQRLEPVGVVPRETHDALALYLGKAAAERVTPAVHAVVGALDHRDEIAAGRAPRNRERPRAVVRAVLREHRPVGAGRQRQSLVQDIDCRPISM